MKYFTFKLFHQTIIIYFNFLINTYNSLEQMYLFFVLNILLWIDFWCLLIKRFKTTMHATFLCLLFHAFILWLSFTKKVWFYVLIAILCFGSWVWTL
jgi:hypothetical protein